MKEKLVIGIDYGTDSCRALVINALSGKEVASYTSFYKRWKSGLYCANIFIAFKHMPGKSC